MNLNHLDLSVSDIPKTRDFLIEYFDFICLSDKGEKMSILQGMDGFVLVLTKLKSSDPPIYPAQFHIGFILDDVKAVESKFDQLKGSGIDLPPALRTNARGTMFYFTAPGNVTIEVSCRQ